MTTYAWKGSDARGRSVGGTCEGDSLAGAAAGLRARGLLPLTLERSDSDPEGKPLVTADAFTLFNRNLAEMTSIGLPLPRAIREIAAGLRAGRFKRALEKIDAALREGKTLDEAVGEDPGTFPPYYRWMLKAGAVSGNLPAMLSAVARNTEGLRLARRAFVEAMIYPALVILLTSILAALSLTVFVPFYRQLSAGHGLEPVGLAGFLETVATTGRVAVWSLAGLAVLSIGMILSLRSPLGEGLLRRLPIIGRIRRHLVLARLLGALGILLRAGVPLPQALPVALGAAGSRQLDRAAGTLAAGVAEGRGLGELLSMMPGVSPEVASFLSVAERSGDAPQSTGHVADLLTEQVVSDSEALFILLMPLALLIAGVFVAGLLVTVVYPYVAFLESLHP